MKRWFILRTTMAGLPVAKVYDREAPSKPWQILMRQADAEKIVEALNRAIGDTEQELLDGHRPVQQADPRQRG